MTAKEMLKTALKAVGKTQTQGAAAIGWTKQQLNNKLAINSLRADDFLDILNGVGIDVVLVNKQTGTVIEKNPETRKVIRKQVGKVMYNTQYSTEIANSFYVDGKHKYKNGSAKVLYIDKEGRYFFAEHNENCETVIIPTTARKAAAFIDKYGTKVIKSDK